MIKQAYFVKEWVQLTLQMVFIRLEEELAHGRLRALRRNLAPAYIPSASAEENVTRMNSTTGLPCWDIQLSELAPEKKCFLT